MTLTDQGDSSSEDLKAVGVVAERTGLSIRTLRHYEEVDILKPSGRTPGGFRLYSESDIDRLLLIRRMKPLGFTLEEIGEFLRAVDALDAAPEDLAVQRVVSDIAAEARNRMADLEKRLAYAKEFISLLEQRSPHAAR